MFVFNRILFLSFSTLSTLHSFSVTLATQAKLRISIFSHTDANISLVCLIVPRKSISVSTALDQSTWLKWFPLMCQL